MHLPFTAYAEDCTLTGEVTLAADRLADLLSSTEEFEVQGAVFTALDDGRVVEAGTAEILRDDLCIVVASGPRGRVERRLWTRQHAVRVRVGPYVVLGYLHAPPTINPLRTTDRRPIVALTACSIGYAEAGTPKWAESEAVLLNTSKIDTLEAATEEDLGLAKEVQLPTRVHPRAKDMTAGDGVVPRSGSARREFVTGT